MSREQPDSGAPELRACDYCGSQWFRLKDDDLPHGDGVLLVDEHGDVAGYAGSFYCMKCGAHLSGVQHVSGRVERDERLRLIQ